MMKVKAKTGFDQDTWERAFGKIKKKKETEFLVQKKVCSYLRREYPSVRFYSTLDGFDFGNQRSILSSIRWYDVSYDGNGVPDLFIFARNYEYTMLVIELKKSTVKTDGNSKHIKNQRAWLNYLSEVGAMATFASGYDAAIKIIDDYILKCLLYEEDKARGFHDETRKGLSKRPKVTSNKERKKVIRRGR